MRKVHRFLAVFAVFAGLYMSVTGLALQTVDLSTLLSHATAANSNLRAIREGRDGPPNFAVARDRDFTAATLPVQFNFSASLARVMKAARPLVGRSGVRFVEFRMVDGRPVGQISSDGKLIRIDAVTGAILIGPKVGLKADLPEAGNRPALRNTIKNIHRMLVYGDVGQTLLVLIAVGMCATLYTGLSTYFQLLYFRRRLERAGLVWRGGGWWRELHRALAIAASAFLVVIVLSGTILSIGSFGNVIYRLANHGTRPGLKADVSAPLADDALPPMLHTTLAGYRKENGGIPIRVLRLRSFAGVRQGIVVAGGEDARQIAYDTTTGEKASLSGPTYPMTGQTFGWQVDQVAKRIHRGDAFGMIGRWISLLTGMALLFLSTSGLLMYTKMWNKRRRMGRSGLFWR